MKENIFLLTERQADTLRTALVVYKNHLQDNQPLSEEQKATVKECEWLEIRLRDLMVTFERG